MNRIPNEFEKILSLIMNMKIFHVLQTIDKERGGGVTVRNLKLIEYLEKFGTDNVILSLKIRI